MQITKETEVESKLESLVKTFDPLSVALFCARVNAQRREGKRKPWNAAPHITARVIEAACAYHRKHYQNEFSEQQYRKAHDLLGEHSDEYQLFALQSNHDLHAFGQAIHRQQFDLQRTLLYADCARLARMYLDTAQADSFRRPLEELIGLRLEFAIPYGVLLLRNSLLDPCHRVVLKCPQNSPGSSIESTEIERFCLHFGRTTREVGEEYRNRRLKMFEKSYLRNMARSTFCDFPLILTDDRSAAIAPFPDQIILALLEKSMQAAQSAGAEVRAKFDNLFALHIRRLCSTDFGGTWRFEDLDRERQLQSKKRADVRMIFCSCDVIVECKSSSQMPQVVTLDVVRKHSITKQIRDAYEQLCSTREHLGLNRDNTYGIVVTFRDLPFANSEWFQRAVLEEFQSLKTRITRSLRTLPQIMSSAEFELLLAISSHTKQTVGSLIDEKLKQPYSHVGDWAIYLGKIAQSASIPTANWAHQAWKVILESGANLTESPRD